MFDNLSVLHHPDVVPVGQPLELVGDQQRGLLTGGVGQGLHDSLFAMGVKAGGRFIQQQQAARHQQRAGDRDTLRLAYRQTPRLIAYGGMDPLRQQGDKLADPGLVQRQPKLCFASFGPRQQHVFPQRGGRQLRILSYPAQQAAPALSVQLAQLYAVDHQRPLIGQKAEQCIQQRAFPGSALADQHHASAGGQRKIKRPRQNFTFRRFDHQVARFHANQIVVI